MKYFYGIVVLGLFGVSSSFAQVNSMSEVITTQMGITRDVNQQIFSDLARRGSAQGVDHLDFRAKAEVFAKKLDEALAEYEEKLKTIVSANQSLNLLLSQYRSIDQSTVYSKEEKQALLLQLAKLLNEETDSVAVRLGHQIFSSQTSLLRSLGVFSDGQRIQVVSKGCYSQSCIILSRSMYEMFILSLEKTILTRIEVNVSGLYRIFFRVDTRSKDGYTYDMYTRLKEQMQNEFKTPIDSKLPFSIDLAQFEAAIQAEQKAEAMKRRLKVRADFLEKAFRQFYNGDTDCSSFNISKAVEYLNEAEKYSESGLPTQVTYEEWAASMNSKNQRCAKRITQQYLAGKS